MMVEMMVGESVRQMDFQQVVVKVGRLVENSVASMVVL
jgi:hypothetical protein